LKDYAAKLKDYAAKLKDYTEKLKDYTGQFFAASDLAAVLCGWKPQVISAFSHYLCDKKRKSAAENSMRSREMRWLEEGSRRVLTSILSISELLIRQREAFCCGGRPAWFLCGAAHSIHRKYG
jgi:hypothetical protein